MEKQSDKDQPDNAFFYEDNSQEIKNDRYSGVQGMVSNSAAVWIK